MSQPPLNPNMNIHGNMMPGNPNQMMPINPNMGGMPPGVPPNMNQMPGMVPGQVPPGGPGMAPVGQNIPMNNNLQPSHHHQQQQQQAASHANLSQNQDNIAKLKTLVPQLKKSLLELMEAAGAHISANSNMDNGFPQGRPNEENLPRFEKMLEDFYSLCNQIEFCLRTILECAIQTRDSNSYIPFQIGKEQQIDFTPPGMLLNSESTVGYPQYLSIIKKQVNYAQTVYDILQETVKKIRQSDQPMMPQPQQQPPPPQQQPQMNPMNPIMQQQQHNMS